MIYISHTIQFAVRTMIVAGGILGAAASAAPQVPQADELPLGFAEAFALADDREAVLEQLVAGTEERDHYTCLWLQGEGRLGEVPAILERWRKRSGKSSAWRRIETRQALLQASDDPDATYRFLERELGVRYDHRRRIQGAIPDLPTQLDPALISTERFLQAVLSQRSGGRMGELSTAVLEQLVRRKLTKEQRAQVLDRLPRPDVPGLMELIRADFAAYPNLSFGSRKIHARLTLHQLEQLRGERPAVLANAAYVDEVMRRLVPGPDESMDVPAEELAYLKRSWAFVETLPPAFNSLKAHILFRWIEHDLESSRVDRERFMRYLRLPRRAPHAIVLRQDRSNRANLAESFDDRSPYAPVGSEEQVVEACLQVLLRDASSPAVFEGVLEKRYVRRIFAETKLLFGDPGDAERYLEMLGGPSALEALRSRVELDIARGSRERFGAQEDVAVALDLKNVEDLIVKVFEIDPVAVFDRRGDLDVSTLDLDGLVPSSERSLRFDRSPLTRHRETLQFESLGRPGLYVIEFIGGGVSSRAVIAKGELHLLGDVTEAGQVFRVINGERRLVNDATLRFGGRDFAADEGGEIFVPFSTKGERRRALLRSGGVAVIASFDHLKEDYRLEAAVHAPGESLIAGSKASFTVRPRLSVAGERVSVELLESAQLVITSTDLNGVQSSKVVPLDGIASGSILEATVQVPERVTSFDVRLTGIVRSVSEDKDIELGAGTVSFPINRIEPMSPHMSLLRRGPQGYVLEVRGRTGEPVRDRDVLLEVKHQWFSSTASERLKTDENGQINLGPLGQIASLRLQQPAEISNVWHLESSDQKGVPGVLHGRAGDELRVPYTGALISSDRGAHSLMEVRGDRPLRDAFEAIAVENRYVVLRGLKAGEYRLVLKDVGVSYRVQVTSGAVVAGHVAGARRALEVSPALPLQITGVANLDGQLVAQLAGVGPHARLHVVGTKFVDPFEPVSGLGLRSLGRASLSVLEAPRSSYESGRRISDEYRYILDRREHDVYPGNMLERPGFLLNPWIVSKTDDRLADDGRDGGAYRGRSNSLVGVGGGAGGTMGGRFGGRARWMWTHNRSVDFLAQPAAVLPNLEPDERGRVVIPLDKLGPNQMLRLVATDDRSTVAWDVTLQDVPVALRDLRLAEPLDAARPMTQSRRIAFVPAGEAIEIRDATSADAKTFDTLGDVYGLFRTMAGEGSEMVKFEFLTRWDRIEPEEKRALYSEFVCHELNVFLKRRDPEFFTSVVAPYIANKGHRTFMDQWLLDMDLSDHLEPWRFERLNVVEKILLLRRVEGDAGGVAKDLMELVPQGRFSLDETFATVLATGGLDGADSQSLELALEERAKDIVDRRDGSDARPTLGIAGASIGRAISPAESAPVERSLADSLDHAEVEMEAIAQNSDAPMTSAPMLLSEKNQARRKKARGYFFRELDETQEYAETRYWRVRLDATNGELVTVSPFWVDFAQSTGSFVSGQFPLATRSHTEMLLALAFLDLPFEAAEHQVIANGRSVRMTAGSPLLLALEDIGDAARAEGSPEVLIGQDFFLPEQRTVRVDGVVRERYVTGEFLTGRPYGCRVVVTNPSSAGVELQALLQIPEGAIPLSRSHYTKGVPVSVGAYGTRSIETFFYFPAEGTFDDFPVHAGQGSTLLAAAEARTLSVVREPSNVDEATWEWVSQNAELDGLLSFLAEGNPRTLDLSQIAWRMGDRASFERVTAALAARGVMSPVLWQYALKHRDGARSREYLGSHQALLGRVGAHLRSELLEVDPMDRATYEHLAYEPLVVGRTHVFGGRRKILNEQLRAQYGRLIERLSLTPVMSGEDRLELTYYMLLQARVAEALDHFARIDRGALDAKLQYDAMAAYLAFYREDVEGARAIAERYVDHPVELWRNRFRGVLAQADEILGGAPAEPMAGDGRDGTQGALAGKEPILAIQIDGGKVIIDHERIDEVELRFHRMDIEFLFSGSPFVRGDGGAFGLVRPNRTELAALERDAGRTAIDLPADFRTANVLVEVRAAGLSRRATYFAGNLAIQGMERYGQIRVVDGASRTPLSKAYVKVYAELASGEVRFHKDGYTDLRGRFDYVSLSGVTGPGVKRFAVLVMHDDAGARIQELKPPVR